MGKVTLLETNECVGDNRLSIFKKRDVKAVATDMAILLGAHSFNMAKNDPSSKRYSTFWTKTSNDDCIDVINTFGKRTWNFHDRYEVCARPVMEFDSIDEIKKLGEIRRVSDGVLELEYGFYPRSAVDKSTQSWLEGSYSNTSFPWTGSNFEYVRRVKVNGKEEFRLDKACVWNFWGKYIRVIANSVLPDGNFFTLSNGESYKNGDAVWLKIEPIKWLVDEEKCKIVTAELPIGGVIFSEEKYDGDFENSFMNEFLNDMFYANMTGHIRSNSSFNDFEAKSNLFGFNFDEASSEDIIKGCIMSDVPVFLHGQTGEGKSSRVKQFDPNVQIIYLQTATPESLNGRNVYNESTGESIDKEPTWYQKLVKRCEEEPNKLHIVFFDELTNATPTIQGMIYNIVLDREINGIWKLPKNARIVAAGNEKYESLSANELSAPLFSRFAHAYINTSVEDFLRWGSTPRSKGEKLDNAKSNVKGKIHPAIIAFVAFLSHYENVLRTSYNGVSPNADPRKWEMASKVLYETGRVDILKSLIGENLTKKLIGFLKEKVISKSDIINHNYDEKTLIMNMSERYATLMGLFDVNDAEYETVRKFIEMLDKNMLELYDMMYNKKKKERTLILKK